MNEITDTSTVNTVNQVAQAVDLVRELVSQGLLSADRLGLPGAVAAVNANPIRVSDLVARCRATLSPNTLRTYGSYLRLLDPADVSLREARRGFRLDLPSSSRTVVCVLTRLVFESEMTEPFGVSSRRIDVGRANVSPG